MLVNSDHGTPPVEGPPAGFEEEWGAVDPLFAVAAQIFESGGLGVRACRGGKPWKCDIEMEHYDRCAHQLATNLGKPFTGRYRGAYRKKLNQIIYVEVGGLQWNGPSGRQLGERVTLS